MRTNVKRVAPTRALASTRRRIWLIAGLAVAALLFVTGMAFASSATIVATGGDVFTPTDYTADQGAGSSLQVTGGSHNVTARQDGPDGEALFRTPTITGGTIAVSGTQFLTAGDYQFFCTIHPSTMNGVLHVTANGTPQARPQATVTPTTRKLSKVVKGGLSVEINSTAKVDGAELVVKLGNTTIGTASPLSWFVGQQFDKVRLTKAGKNKLKRKRKATLTVTAVVPFGTPVSVKAKLT